MKTTFLVIPSNMAWSVVLLLMVMSYLTKSVDATSQCPAIQNMKFTIQTSRNISGHWSSKISVANSGGMVVDNSLGSTSSNLWSVDLDHQKGGCGGMETFTTTITVPRPHPSPGYELFEGVGYYKFHTDAKTWMEGLRACEQEGAHLAIINSEKEAEVLKNLFAKYPHNDNAEQANVAGIGFHDRYKEGEYITIFDEPLANTGFTGWSTILNQPDNWQGSDTNPGEDCGSIHRDGGLNDISCDERMVFICEQEL